MFIEALGYSEPTIIRVAPNVDARLVAAMLGVAVDESRKIYHPVLAWLRSCIRNALLTLAFCAPRIGTCCHMGPNLLARGQVRCGSFGQLYCCLLCLYF